MTPAGMRMEESPEAVRGMLSGCRVVRARWVGTGGERRIVSSMQARRRGWVVIVGEVRVERVG